MNRELKFRAWDEANRIMHYDFQFIKSGEEGNDWILFVSDKQPISDYEGWAKNPYFRQQLIIMQFTGLKDKNGKEIYEGDIFMNGQSKRIIEFYNGNYHAVTPSKSEAILLSFIVNKDGNVVIGNIHENPELLNS